MRKREPGRRSGGAMLALAVASGAMILVFGGCGQSGPLYLPKKASPSASASAPPPVPVSPAAAGPPSAFGAAPDRGAHG